MTDEYEELAAILEYDQGNTRQEAERLAREILELRNATKNKAGNP